MAPEGVDVIGDIHGHADKLEGLLALLGYVETAGVWLHPGPRRAVFVGDLIDLGPKQLRTLEIVRAMVEAGSAQMILGNHEFNAIAWSTPDPADEGEFMRPHGGPYGAGNRHQHQAFLDAVGEGSPEHEDWICWFRTLPLWLESGGLRIVHACWSQAHIDYLSPQLGPLNTLTNDVIIEGAREGSRTFEAVEMLLKGPEIPLPAGCSYLDSYGIERRRARQRWWNASATTLASAAVIAPNATKVDGTPFPGLPNVELGDSVQPPYACDIPVIFGHYWRSDGAEDTPMTLCVDRSAGKRGPLASYRWDDGDTELSPERVVMFGAEHAQPQ